ncbi:MAG: cyclase family protein [Acidimicrobiales bacterium]|nr:cyclase family protein [Acidimicrobiales bacterium]
MSFNAFFHEVAAEVRNWGRWGDDDRIGTLNHITDAARVEAAASVEHGRAVSLAIDLKHDGVQIGQIPTRINPIHVMGTIDHADLGDPDGDGMVPHFSDDMVTMGLQAGTHWDGLSHVSYNHTLYNGIPASSITARDGSTELGIEHVRSLVGRGVLLDIAGSKGLDRLADNHEVTGADLDEAAEWAGVEVRAGDIVLIRTGRMRLYLEQGATQYTMGEGGDASSPGPGIDAVRWFHRHDIAAAATDTYMFEVFPAQEWDNVLGVHCLDVVDMGFTQGQNWHLEELAEICKDYGRHHFLLEATPEPFVGATGAPVNPIALF